MMLAVSVATAAIDVVNLVLALVLRSTDRNG
jgi:hypothetical protein